jgi:hypothetical protein
MSSRSSTIVCLSAGLLRPKKRDTPLARQNLYMNYGLLGLATVLHRAGLDTLVVDGLFEPPSAVVGRLFAQGHLPSRSPILLSLLSSLALGWAAEAVAEIRRHDPLAKIVVGGRWVTADDGVWIRRKLPGIDLVVYGTAEARILDLVRPDRWVTARGTDLRPGVLPPDRAPHRIAYDLMHGYLRYQPSFEVSRGCGMGCSFCAEATTPLGPLKSPTEVADELEHCARLYGEHELHPYAEASFFRPDGLWCTELGQILRARGLALPWRTETRVDALSEKHIEALARAGLRVVDLGLESASPAQLVAMKKTPNPAIYLERASRLLAACRDAGIWVKANILLHAGETRRSLDETREWLHRHRSAIKGVSVGPTIVFRYGRQTRAYLASLATMGAHAVDPNALERDGFAHLHLSDELPHEAAVEASLALSRELMTARDYFDLKSFSYLARGTTWEEFVCWTYDIDPNALSFRMPEMLAQVA